jgi:hypothetical protein
VFAIACLSVAVRRHGSGVGPTLFPVTRETGSSHRRVEIT